MSETPLEPVAGDPSGTAPRGPRQGGRYVKVFVLVGVVIVLVALAMQNTRPVQLSWIFGSGESPLVWVIGGAAVLGWVAGIVTAGLIRRSSRRGA